MRAAVAAPAGPFPLSRNLLHTQQYPSITELCHYLAARSVNVLRLEVLELSVVEDDDSSFGVYYRVKYRQHKEG